MWYDVPESKITDASKLHEQTGMVRERFYTLWSCILFSNHPDVQPPNIYSEKYSWMLIDDFVEAFNESMSKNLYPSEIICVD